MGKQHRTPELLEEWGKAAGGVPGGKQAMVQRARTSGAQDGIRCLMLPGPSLPHEAMWTAPYSCYLCGPVEGVSKEFSGSWSFGYRKTVISDVPGTQASI